MSEESQHVFTKGKSCLTNLVPCYDDWWVGGEQLTSSTWTSAKYLTPSHMISLSVSGRDVDLMDEQLSA